MEAAIPESPVAMVAKDGIGIGGMSGIGGTLGGGGNNISMPMPMQGLGPAGGRNAAADTPRGLIDGAGGFGFTTGPSSTGLSPPLLPAAVDSDMVNTH